MAKTNSSIKGYVSEEDRINRLIRTLNKNPDILHNDFTPSVLALGQMKPDAIIPYLKNPLNSENGITRLRAQRALENSLMKEMGFVFGLGWANQDGEEKFRKLWKEHGNYIYDAPEKERKKAIKKWLDWVLVVD